MLKADFYVQLQKQIEALVGSEPDVIANMANISALLFGSLDKVNWVGFYRVIDEELVLGPFQGKIACIRIPIGIGVCGTAVSENKTQRIGDVHKFSGHIACDVSSNSEIVIPISVDNKIIAVLDVDSIAFDRFDLNDQLGLESIVKVLEKTITTLSDDTI
jgi:L-methionine (R)-S-oxide reductase